MRNEPTVGPPAPRPREARPRPLLAALAGAAVLAAPLSGQDAADRCRVPRLLPPAGDVRVGPGGRLCTRAPLTEPGPARTTPGHRPGPETDGPGAARAFATSLILPGAGQWLQGQGRAYLYLGLELAAWGGFLHGRLEGADLRDRYRDLAWTVARNREGGAGRDGDFRYYEALAQYSTSGAWDRDPDRPGIQPESDPETYNGRIWSLARELYSLSGEDEPADPEARERALEYYRRHGYPPDMAWDWRGDPDAAARYRRLIEESDDAFRRATIVLAVIAANHVLSAVDGFLSARIASDRVGGAAALGSPSSILRADRRWSLVVTLGGAR